MRFKYLGLALILGFLIQLPLMAVITTGNILYDGKAALSTESIPHTPLIAVGITGTNVSFDAFVFQIDGVQVTTTNPHNYSYDQTYFYYQAEQRLEVGSHTFKLDAVDDGGALIPSYEFTGSVSSHTQEIFEMPLAIPNPATSDMRITYKMASEGDVYLNIYNLNGELVWEQKMYSGQIGAQVGYNEVEWDLTSGFGEALPNGPYICLIMKKEEGVRTAMEKIKLFILR